jgi:hypothetical protein
MTDMLLDVERAWVEGPDVTEGVETSMRQYSRETLSDRQGNQLNDKSRNVNGGD